jgi:integrase
MGARIREKIKGSGVWWVFIHHDGKRRSKMIGDKALAKEVAAKIDAKLVLNEFGMNMAEKKTPFFGEYSRKWLAFIKMNRRDSTYERYAQVLRDYVNPIFKDKPIDKISRGDIRDLLVKQSVKLNVSIVRDVLSGVMGFAVDDEIIQSNPVIGVIRKLNLRKGQAKETDPLTESELDAFINTFKEEIPGYYCLFLLAVRTGLRMGEILALEWGDVQFNNPVILEGGKVENRPYIFVQRTYRRGITTMPKNGKTRKVDISNQLALALKEHQAKEKREAFLNGLGDVQGLVFHRKGGDIMEQNYIRRVYERALSKAGIRKIKFHALRHTFASLLLSKGESPVYVKEQLGHSSIQITVDIYGKWMPTSRMVGVNRLDTPQHLTAPQTHPEKTEKAQHVEVTPKTIIMVPKVGIEPTRAQSSLDFESSASTSFTTPACFF